MYIRQTKTCSICGLDKTTRFYYGDVCLACYTRIKRHDPDAFKNIPTVKNAQTKQCVICGQSFNCINGSAKTCSQTCRSRLNAKHVPEKEVICRYCGQTFVASGMSYTREYCSLECRNKQRYLRESYTPNDRLKKSIRSRIHDALRGSIKPGSLTEALGCSIDELKKHLEFQFYNRADGTPMTWKNRGLMGWHIDHIKPLASFDLTDPEQFKQACHYTNLQPLWAEDNLKKGDKYD